MIHPSYWHLSFMAAVGMSTLVYISGRTKLLSYIILIW